MTKAQILIAAVDPGFRRSLAFAIEAEGFATMTMEAGEAASFAAHAREAACLVLDHRPSVFDAVAVLRDLHARGIATPAVIISSANAVRFQRRAAQTGAVCVEKPLLGDALTRAIRTVIGSTAKDDLK